jgi:hypothetical protein
MALHGNYSLNTKTAGRYLGGDATAHASGVGTAYVKVPANWGQNGSRHNISFQDGADVVELLSVPAGYGGRGWKMPITAGGLSSHNAANGLAAWTAKIAEGRNLTLAAPFAGIAAYTGTGQLVVSGSGTFAGVAAFSGNVIAALAATGTFAGVASFSGAVVAKGNIAATFAGVGSFSAIRYATGSMSGSFAPPVTLEAQGFSAYLLDTEIVETGLTLRQALRLVTAATAGKISGGGTATETIRNAVADSANRMVATVDSSGNRTAITYDLD